jgi:hypothetical protein
MFWCSVRTPDKRGGDLKNALTVFALAARHLDLQVNRMKTNRQGLNPADALAFANHLTAPALWTKEKSIQRLDGHKDATVFDLRLGRMVTLGYTENLV